MRSMEIIELDGMQIHLCLDATETGKKLTMFKWIIPAGTNRIVAHYHEGFDETFYGLKGVTTCTVDGRTVALNPGDGIFIPRGAIHSFENKTSATIEFLSFSNPGLLGPDYFHDIAGIQHSGDAYSIEKLKEVMLAHGVVPVEG